MTVRSSPLLYIVAFAMFIYGLMGLTGPKTAVRGNLIAAVGMAVAVVATLLGRCTSQLGADRRRAGDRRAAGRAVGAAVKMTAMPQMVALFNGVGGGAVALIAWSEFRTTDGFTGEPVYVVIASLFAAIVGSISFWGSLVAFGKLQEILPGRPIGAGQARSSRSTGCCCSRPWRAAVVGAATRRGAADAGSSGCWCWRRCSGVMVVLPIGGADMPVVISLLNALTGLSAAAAGLALNNTAMIVAGMIVGASGSILTNLMAKAMNRSIPAIVARRLRRRRHGCPARTTAVGPHREGDHRGRRGDPDGLRERR